MPVAAPLIGAAAGIGGGIMSANATKKAAGKAAAAQTAADQAAIAEQQRQYNTTRSDLMPWQASGSAAQDQINALLGLPGANTRGGVDWAAYVNSDPWRVSDWQNNYKDKTIGEYGQYNYQYDLNRGRAADPNYTGFDLSPYKTNPASDQQAAIDALKLSPLYQSLFSNGENAILSNASATGGLRGGNTQNSLANFGRDTLSAVIQNQLQNLTGVSSSGQNAAAQTGTLGANSANSISNLLSNSGTANANAALASGAANAGAINSIVGTIGGLAGNKDVTSWAGKLF